MMKRFSQTGKELRCDFDTGNRDYTVLDVDDCRDISSNFPRVMRRGRHLGWVYHFYPCRMKVGITDGEKGRCLSKIVEGVGDWNTLYRNPCKIVNPIRIKLR